MWDIRIFSQFITVKICCYLISEALLRVDVADFSLIFLLLTPPVIGSVWDLTAGRTADGPLTAAAEFKLIFTIFFSISVGMVVTAWTSVTWDVIQS